MPTTVDLVAPQSGGLVFKFEELENPDGGASRRIAFTYFDVAPRGYEELFAAKLHQGIVIPLDIHDAQILDHDVDGLDPRRKARIQATLESPFSATAIGLVRGG